jgi:hypothetical protein
MLKDGYGYRGYGYIGYGGFNRDFSIDVGLIDIIV